MVEHDYSASAGRASALKAYLVERNRLYTVAKVFPSLLWPLVPWYSAWRYLAHIRAMWKQRGLASEFGSSGEKWWRLVLIVLSAHGSALLHAPSLLRKRRLVGVRRSSEGLLSEGCLGGTGQQRPRLPGSKESNPLPSG